MGLAAAQSCSRFEAIVALLLTQAQLVFGALGQAVVGQLQFAHVHVFLIETIHAQQRVQVLGVHAQLLQLAILVGDDLRKELVQAHKALQVFLEQVELIDLLAGFLEGCFGLFQAGAVAVLLGGTLEVQRVLA
ncbi:hypothetical protein FQZ97_942570 [compost metagenome]